MIAKDKVSIVDPTAGTTRDRVSIIADLVPPDEGEDSRKKIEVEVTDTGGFGVYVEDGRRFNDVGADLSKLTDDIEFQISQAVAGADLVLFVLDAQAGVTVADERIAKLLRERVLGKRGTGTSKHLGPRGKGTSKGSGKGKAAAKDEERESGTPHERPDREIQVMVVANKCDGPRWEAHAMEAAALGFGEPIAVSAKNNYFRRDFLDAMYNAVKTLPGVHPGEKSDLPEMKIAIIGKRNAGKSSLVNRLAGEDRVIVSEIAGTTRDSVDVRVNMDGRDFVVIDTAGLRKKKSFSDRIEHFAFDRAQRSIKRADVVFMMVDATEPLGQIDHQLMKLVQQAFKPVVIVVNKWDLAEGRPAAGTQAAKAAGRGGAKGKAVTTEMYEEYLRAETKGLDFAPLAFVSAKNGTNVHELIDLAFELLQQAGDRAPTGKLNRLLRGILQKRGPSSKLGTFAKAYFISQVAVHPPTVVIVVNKPELFTNNYQRFLLNRLRDVLPFPEVPIKLIIKERKRARIQDLLSGEYQRLKEEGAKVVGQDVADEVESAEREATEAFEPDELAAMNAAGGAEEAEIEEGAEDGAAIDLDNLSDDAEAYFDDSGDIVRAGPREGGPEAMGKKGKRGRK